MTTGLKPLPLLARHPVLAWPGDSCRLVSGTSWLAFSHADGTTVRLRNAADLAELRTLLCRFDDERLRSESHAELGTLTDGTDLFVAAQDASTFGIGFGKKVYRLETALLADLAPWLCEMTGAAYDDAANDATASFDGGLLRLDLFRAGRHLAPFETADGEFFARRLFEAAADLQQYDLLNAIRKSMPGGALRAALVLADDRGSVSRSACIRIARKAVAALCPNACDGQ